MKTLKTLPLLLSFILTALLPLTASAQAPSSLVGKALDLTITYGTGPFYQSGSLSASFPDSSHIVAVNTDGDTLNGTYTYYANSSGGALLVVYFTVRSSTFKETFTLSFSSASSGNYYVTLEDYPQDYGTGTFVVRNANGTPGAPTLLTPGDGEIIDGQNAYFSWSQTAPASSWYHCYLQRNGSKCVELWTQSTEWSTNLSGGSYTWWVQGWNSAGSGAWSEAYNFSIESPGVPGSISLVGTKPEDNTPVYFYLWWPDPYASWYEICITRNGSVVHDVWISTNHVSTWTDWEGLKYFKAYEHLAGTYDWWVRGWSPAGFGPWSAKGTLVVPDLRPSAVTLLSPTGTQTDSTLHFTWDGDVRATWYEFCLMKGNTIVSDRWFGHNRYGRNGTVFWMDEANSYGAGTYTAWIRGWNIQGMSPWSSGLSFQVPPQTPDAPSLSSPNGTTYTPRPTFQWQAASGATWYYIVVLKDGVKFCEGWAATTTWTPSVNLPMGNYTWWVRGWNSDGYGAWSPPLAFMQMIGQQ